MHTHICTYMCVCTHTHMHCASFGKTASILPSTTHVSTFLSDLALFNMLMFLRVWVYPATQEVLARPQTDAQLLKAQAGM